MLYVVETTKDVETAAQDLEEAVKRNKFGVLGRNVVRRGARHTAVCHFVETDRLTHRRSRKRSQ